MLSAFQRFLYRYPREALLFLLASFVNAAGSAFMWPLTTLYVHTQLHRTMAEAGFVLMLQSLAGIAGQFAGGALFHRLGAKRLIVGSLLLQAAIQLAIVFTAGWSGYIALPSAWSAGDGQHVRSGRSGSHHFAGSGHVSGLRSALPDPRLVSSVKTGHLGCIVTPVRPEKQPSFKRQPPGKRAVA